MPAPFTTTANIPRRIAARAALALLLAAIAALAAFPGANPTAAQTTDYDRDNDNLIDIRTLAQLNAIRYDLNGDGTPSSQGNIAYSAAFPGAASGMGCLATCTGYELRRSLNFDQNNDGEITEADDDYWNNGAGWHPIGAPPNFNVNMGYCGNDNTYCYAATFEGNGHTISNLYMNHTITNNFGFNQVGLFGGIYGAVRNVGLVNPQISITRSGTSGSERYTNIGGLVGFMGGGATAIAGSWVDGGSITFIQGAGTRSTVSVGCLTGRAFQPGGGITITASDASCAVDVTSPLRHRVATNYGSVLRRELADPQTNNKDTNIVYAGGLGGYISGASITASYATGNLACRGGDLNRNDPNRDGGPMNCAGLVAFYSTGTIDSSYATGNVLNDAYFRPIRIDGVLQPGADTVDCIRIYNKTFYSAGLVGITTGSASLVTRSYSTGRVDAKYEGVRCTDGRVPIIDSNSREVHEPVQGLGRSDLNGRITDSYWDGQTGGIRYGGGRLTTARLQSPTDYTAPYANWNVDLDGDNEVDDPWDFGNNREYPILKYGRNEERIARQRGEAPPPEEPEEYVAPPIVYNLNIRFNVKGLTLDEGESATYRVRMSQSPVGHPARIAITSNNPDVVVSPTELTFSSANFREWQTVKVSALRDANDTDESATIAHRGPSLGYGSILVTVNDTWPGAATETVNGHTVTTRHTLDAPYGVTVTAPATLDANTHITIAGPPPGTPEGAPGYGLGQSAAARMLADIRVSGAPSAGLTICLPIPAALAAEAGDRPLTLLRYANAAWTPAAAPAPTNSTDGDNGADGANGANGAASQNGANGAAGQNGANGAASQNGANGAAGQDGANGAARQAGATGADGAARQDGANGAAGADGAAQQDGAAGADGVNSADGAAQQDGAAGAHGVDSADGAAQPDGAAGANGVIRQTAADGTPLLCAAGITEYGVFAVAYTLPALGAPSDLTATPGAALGSVTLTWTPGANAARHWLAGVKSSDRSQFAVWAAAANTDSHTVTDLEPGATYIFTITAGRGEGDSRQWSAWAPWATATPPAPQPTPTPTPKPTFNPPPFPLSQ